MDCFKKEGMAVVDQEKKRRLVFTGMMLLALMVCAVVGSYFWMMSHPAKENMGYSLYPNPEQSMGWSYRVNGTQMEPQFDELGYFPSFPVEGEVSVIEATRVMTEQRREGILRFIDYIGLQIYLDDKLLFTDFPEAENRYGTLLPWNAALAAELGPLIERYVPLPQDCVGKTLTVVSYTSVYDGLAGASYPELYESTLLQGNFVPNAVLPVTAAAVAAVLGLMLLLLFLFGLWHGSADWPSLLLVLFAILSMVAFSGESFPVTLAIPGGGTPDAVYFVKAVAIDAMLLYFATQMKKRHGIPLAAAAVVHILFHGTGLFSPNESLDLLRSAALPILLLLALVMMLLERKRQPLFRLLLRSMIPIGVVFVALIVISPRNANANGIYQAFSTAIYSGNWMPLTLILSTILSLLSGFLLFVRYIQTHTRERMERQAYQMQLAHQQENMDNLALALDEAKSARHEYRHHLDTLRGLLGAGGAVRAADYLNSILTQEQSQPSIQFSPHPVVNVIVSALYRKAKQLDIEVKSSVTVPEQLAIADADLSLMMNNMIENAFEAIAQIPDERKKYIHLKIGVVDEYIFYLGCENSYAGSIVPSEPLPPSTKQDPESHGFGLAAIERTAKQNHGFLVISGDGAAFKAQVRLNLPK